MSIITHINYKDQNGHIYCCLRNKVVELNQQQQEQFCNGCKMFGGTADGKGVICIWEDLRNVSDPHIVHDPVREFIKNQTRIVPPDHLITLTSFCTN
ncbi:MAG: hypothetical protein K0S39_181 [Paenibacillus sp.]|nr:hypothetical protein [Paenibacillus sp.]